MAKKINLKKAVIMAVCLLGIVGTATGQIIYVDPCATGANDGSSWANAFNYLQDALADPCLGSGDEIWVAEGTYKPDRGGGQTPNDREATFQLINGVGIYGGFPTGGGSWEQRDPNAYETILSGDIGVADVNTDNSYHVVTGSTTNATAIIDGFTITAGNANSGPYLHCYYGGGMYNGGGSPTVRNCTFSGNQAIYGGGMHNFDWSDPNVTNCTFSGNSAAENGGGMCNEFSSSPAVTNCTFSGNEALSGDGGGIYCFESSPAISNCTFNGNSGYRGGGMYNLDDSDPNVTNCTFSGNSASRGGGMYNGHSSPMLTNCTFSGNSPSQGGGMYNDNSSSPTLTNCTFSGNSSGQGGGMYNSESDPNIINCTFSGNVSTGVGGGGMYNNSNSSPTVTNCTFSGNWATQDGGGMHNRLNSSPTVTNCTFSGNSANALGGGMYNYESDPTLNNCILWGNTDSGGTDESAQIHGGTPAVNYSCVQAWTGGLGGFGNIDDDPCLVDPNGPDDIAGTEDDNVRLSADSNCIDAGDNTVVPPDTADLDGDSDTSERTPLDLDGLDRFIDDPNTPDTGVILPASYPENVDMGAYEWYGGPACGDAEHPYPPGDSNRDCHIDFFDFAIVAAHWLECTAIECD